MEQPETGGGRLGKVHDGQPEDTNVFIEIHNEIGRTAPQIGGGRLNERFPQVSGPLRQHLVRDARNRMWIATSLPSMVSKDPDILVGPSGLLDDGANPSPLKLFPYGGGPIHSQFLQK